MKILSIISCNNLVLISFLTLFIFASCGKELGENSEKGNLQINLGIQDYASINKIGSASVKNKVGIHPAVESYGQFDVITEFAISATLNDKSEGNKLLSTSISNKKLNKLAAVPMPDAVKYRLIIYREGSSNYEYNVVLEKGQNPNISLFKGYTYRWVAYSINDSIGVPDVNNNIINKSDIANKDFMFDSGNITIENENNNLNIIFRRQTSVIEVNIDTKGVFSKILNTSNLKLLNGSATVASRTANFNINTEEFEGDLQDVIVESIPLSYADDASLMDSVRAVGKIYSVGFTPIPANSIDIRFESLKIKLDEGTVRTFSGYDIDLKHPEVPSIKGYKYVITANIIESAIQVVEDGTKWARSNLWYDAAAPVGHKYRFRASPHYRDMVSRTTASAFLLTDPNDIWRFGAEIPDGSRGTADPCAQVYPAGLWKMPTSEDYETLTEDLSAGSLIRLGKPNNLFILDRGEPMSGLLVGTTKPYEIVAGWYNINQYEPGREPSDGYSAKYRPSDVNTKMHNLYFGGYGYFDNSQSLTRNKYVDRPKRTSILNLLGLVELGTTLVGNGYYWAKNGNTASYFKFGSSGLELLNVDIILLALGVLDTKDFSSQVVKSVGASIQDYRMNIRCVRNSN